MRQKAFKFDANDKKMIKLLNSIGINKNTSKILIFFFHTKETISAQLERILELRQPEVSVALRALIQKEWLIKTNIKKGCKGRPTYAYRLVLTPQTVIRKIIQSKQKEIKKLNKNIECLAKLVMKISSSS